MKQDKAIIKALKSQESTTLPEDFNARLMNKVYLASAKQKRQNTILSYVFISLVSLGLIVLAVYLLKDYLSFNTLLKAPLFTYSAESKSIFEFSVYIAFLVFILVSMDGYFRNLRDKRLNKNN